MYRPLALPDGAEVVQMLPRVFNRPYKVALILIELLLCPVVVIVRH